MSIVLEGSIVKYKGGDVLYTLSEDMDTTQKNKEVTIYTSNGAEYSARIGALKVVKLINVPVLERNRFYKLGIDRVISNPPATIVFFNDGSKQVVKVSKDDTYNLQTGVMLAMLKHYIMYKAPSKVTAQALYNAVKKDMFHAIKVVQDLQKEKEKE